MIDHVDYSSTLVAYWRDVNDSATLDVDMIDVSRGEKARILIFSDDCERSSRVFSDWYGQ